MPQTNLLLPQGYVGPGAFDYPANPNPGGAIIFVLSTIGQDSRGRVVFPGGTFASSSSTNVQGPYGDPTNPMASVFGVNGALSIVKAGRGDLVVCLPGHVETIGAAKSVPSGVTILGCGDFGNRPTFTLNTAITANISLAAGCRLQNLVIDGTGFDAITSLITCAGTAYINNCHIIMATSTNQAITGVTIGANNCRISRTLIDAIAGAGGAQAILSSAAVARLTVEGSQFIGDFSAAVLVSASTNHITDMLIKENTLVNRNGTAKAVISFTTSSTGILRDNVFSGTTWASAADAIAGSTSVLLRWFQNYGFDDGAGAVSGILIPAAGTIS